MPWCEPCAKYFTPTALTTSGDCPTCGVRAIAADIHGRVTAKNLDLRALAAAGDPGSEKVPWHFKLLVVLLVAYLGWRVVSLFI
ncbi:MAG: hypothetical protein F2712_01225 [Actinobacteria bacterium]|jgi:hypothetical protein|uniref:Unannotated protein n=1 Tax=freshwater metagenome TaxID=449393 RepID=A0A6J6U083_9ZZZZ|nr:hypothetical protein [Actinomycetota bacterium]